MSEMLYRLCILSAIGRKVIALMNIWFCMGCALLDSLGEFGNVLCWMLSLSFSYVSNRLHAQTLQVIAWRSGKTFPRYCRTTSYPAPGQDMIYYFGLWAQFDIHSNRNVTLSVIRFALPPTQLDSNVVRNLLRRAGSRISFKPLFLVGEAGEY